MIHNHNGSREKPALKGCLLAFPGSCISNLSLSLSLLTKGYDATYLLYETALLEAASHGRARSSQCAWDAALFLDA